MIFRDITSRQENTGSQAIILEKKKKNTSNKLFFTKKSPLPASSSFLLIKASPPNRTRELTVILGLACLMLFVITAVHLEKNGLRFKRHIVDAASEGFQKIMEGASTFEKGEFENAKILFSQAQNAFQNIQNTGWFSKSAVKTIEFRDPLFEAADAFLTAGKHLAGAGKIFSDITNELQILPKQFFEKNLANDLSKPSLTEKLKKQLPALENALNSLFQANEAIQKVPVSFIPTELKDRFSFAKTALASLKTFLSSFRDDLPALLTLLGDQEPHTFLVLLQNNAELRPTGGFIGNYLILQTNDGYLEKLEVHDVYSADHQLQEVLAPPQEILPVNQRWYLRDSNYSGHFPLSAQKAAWFLEKEGGPGVDTVLALDQSFVSELLTLTGPIKMSGLSQPLTSENFTAVLSYMIESKLLGRENPKALLKDFVPALEKSLLQHGHPIDLTFVLRQAIQEKHLLGYSKDPQIQGFFERQGMAGLMKKIEAKEDYLAVVHTSIGGNKSDAFISEKIIHDTFIKRDGRLIDEITLTRSHEWNAQTERKLRSLLNSFGFSEFPKKVLEILGRSRNLHMLRIYVPAGAVLESSSDKSITTHFDSETGKTYFSASLEVGVGDSKTLKIRYRLPFLLELDPVDKYLFFIEKQAGQENVMLQKNIFPEARVLNYYSFPKEGSLDSDGVWSLETELKKDMNFSSVWGK